MKKTAKKAKRQAGKNAKHHLCVYFGLSKGEGEWPEPDILTKKEKADPRTFSTFHLDLDEGAVDIDPEVITSCTILYDGISPVEGDEPEAPELGLRVSEGRLAGRIRPIIDFQLSQEVDPEEFRRFVWGSFYSLSPTNADEPFQAEDWNGYTEILSDKRMEEFELHLKAHGAYSGKKTSPDILVSGLPATEMGGPNPSPSSKKATSKHRAPSKKARRH